MNKKGQAISSEIGIVIMVFLTVIVGVILFQAIAQEAGRTTSLSTINYSIATATAGTQYNYTGLRDFGSLTVTNASNGVTILSGNYTLASDQVINGNLAATIAINSSSEMAGFEWWIVSTDAQSSTYIPNSGARAMVSMILIFFALAIAVVALVPTLRSQVLSGFGK